MSRVLAARAAGWSLVEMGKVLIDAEYLRV